jgi:pyrroline-5-carboxylate reductase
MQASVAFIGAGNMARALIGGLLKSGAPGAGIYAHDAKPEALAAAQADFGVASLDSATRPLGALIVAVKPVDVKQALSDVHKHIGPNTVVISIAAGIPTVALAGWLPPGTALVRAMPNTPALIGAGISGVFATPATSSQQRGLAEQILSAAGEVIWVEEETALDAVTAVSGSGPAYVFYLIEALEEAAMAEGLAPNDARRLALATCAGASQLAVMSSEPPARLRAQVTSKGGTTAAALDSFKNDGFIAMVERAVHAARLRSTELGQVYGAAPAENK